MKTLLATPLIILGASILATSTASAQATVTALPVNFESFALSPSGAVVSGHDALGAGLWAGGLVTTLPGNGWDLSFAGNMNFDGSRVVGRFDDPLSTSTTPGYWQSGIGKVSLGFPAGFADGCSQATTASSVSWDGFVIGGFVLQGCDSYPFRWTSATGYQILDTTSSILPLAKPRANVLATSGNGLVSAGWIETTTRSGAVWDAAGVLSFPLITASNADGIGELYAMSFTGDAVVGSSALGGPVVVSRGVIHYPTADAGLASFGEGMLDITADGAVAVGTGGGFGGIFGNPDTGLIWTSWAGGQDINTLFAAYGVSLPTGKLVRRASGISLDGHTFLVQEPPLQFGQGDSFLVTLPNSWVNLGGNSPGSANGIPQLVGQGYLTDGAPARLTLSQAAPSSTAFLAISTSDNPVPLWGGVLHTTNYFKLIPFPTNASGGANLDVTWPAGLAGATLYSQIATLDFSAPDNVTLTNAVSATGF